MKPRPATVLVVLTLLIAHVAIGVHSLRRNSAVIDEIGHLAAGLGHWQHGHFFLYHQNPPLVRLLATLPILAARPETNYDKAIRGPDQRSEWPVGRDIMFANRDRYHDLLCLGRYVILGLSLLGGWLLYHWSRQLFGTAGGLIALALWVFNPNILAHAGVLTTDPGATVFGFLATYVFWRQPNDHRRFRRSRDWQPLAR